MVCISLVFVYDVAGIHKIVGISSFKMPSRFYAQVPTGLQLHLGGLTIHGEHFKLNPNSVE